MQATITQSIFGQDKNGSDIHLFEFQNEAGGRAQITNYGGIIVSIEVPDRKGVLGEVVLGFDNLEDYLTTNPFFGCITGRYANRINKGIFPIDQDTFALDTNNNGHHLHGGDDGFDKKIWQPTIINKNGLPALQLFYASPDGEEGYPGQLDCTVTYSFQKDNKLIIDYQATTSKTTILNLTNHSYFNLRNGGVTDIHQHELRLHADSITPTDSTMIPTGKLMAVKGTPFNFLNYKPIGKDIEELHPQIIQGGGYDHNFVIRAGETPLTLCAEVVEPFSGRTMEVYTTEPGVQLYTANFLTATGKGGIVYKERSAFCLETQHYPDSPNHPNFPTTLLHPEETFESQTIYKFGIIK